MKLTIDIEKENIENLIDSQETEHEITRRSKNVAYELVYQTPGGDICSEIFDTEESMQKFIRTRHIQPMYYTIIKEVKYDFIPV